MIRAERLALLLLLLVLTASLEPAHGQAREETNVVYGMHYGTALLMDVAYPDSANGYGVLFVPGSGWHETGRYGATPLKELGFVSDREEVLTEAGYTVFTINHRAAPRFTYPAAVEDARRAVRYIRHHAERFGIRRTPLGGVGLSSGGHLVSLLGVLDGEPLEDPDPVNRRRSDLQCVAALRAPHDLLKAAETSRESGVLVSFLGRPTPTPNTDSVSAARWAGRYREASPVTHVTRGDARFLLVHGTADQVVPVEQSVRMRDTLVRRGVPVQLVTLDGVGHGAFEPDQFDYGRQLVPWLGQCLRVRSARAPGRRETK